MLTDENQQGVSALVSSHLPITALRVANEAFLVASTIERCPKTMMLRELVMNALESASMATDGRKRVEIGAMPGTGARKLRIWNTGPGMSAAELHQICDLASSLHKQNAMDRNFGMGAKVASLPSNKLGLRYRSCRDGVVSEVMMGQRGGIYGRIPYRAAATPVEAEVDDVTAGCAAEAEYDLATDWTEVVLFGNRAEQDTVADPYNRDPGVEPAWILNYLTRRFHTMPGDTVLHLQAGIAGDGEHVFRGMAKRLEAVTRRETVQAMEGIRVHYAYDSRDDAGTVAEADGVTLSGQAGIIHRGEIYAMRNGQEWLLDAPSFGMPFGARHYSVFVELPDDFAIRPDLYRQFLRFQHGGQRQVALSDFAGVVRDAIPAWLRDIIASYGPPQSDYMSELEGELQDLLVELGIIAQPRGARPITPLGQPRPRDEDAPLRPKPPPKFESPPEIVSLRDQEQIDEKGLQGRAAKFYPAAHQIFVNLTYSAFQNMAMQLEQEFEAVPGGSIKRRMAAELAEWAISRKISRAIVYGLGKRAFGWRPEEIEKVQSPECLSIAADDYAMVLEPARRRMAEMLGIEATSPSLTQPAELSFMALKDRRLSSDLIDAQQAARRAQRMPLVNPAPILRRVSTIEMQRRNWDSALDWARQAIAADPIDASNHLHLASVLVQCGDLEGAERAVAEAIVQDPKATVRGYRLNSVIASNRKDVATSLEWARKSVDADLADDGSHLYLAGVLLRTNEFDEAEQAVERAIALRPAVAPKAYRQHSMIAQSRKDLPKAIYWIQRSIEIDPMESSYHNHLSGLLMQQGDLDGAEEAAFEALRLGTGDVSSIRRQIDSIATRKLALQTAS